jgi:phosphopantetheinyl transferase (holo-ACP synthase)
MAEEIKKTPDVKTPETSQEEVKEVSKVETDQDRIDNIVKTRIERERKKFEERLEKELKERDRLTQLSAEEKEKELTAKYERELEAKAKDIAIRENRLEAIELLSKAKVPIELVDYVVDEDKDRTVEKTEAFIKNYQQSVTETVAEQLKGTPPKALALILKDNQERLLQLFRINLNYKRRWQKKML